MAFRRAFLITSALILLVSVAFGAGYYSRASQDAAARQWPVLGEAYQVLEKNGFAALPTGTVLEYGLIRGMLQAYNDPYTMFVEPPQHELEGNVLNGSFGGIGASLERDANGLVTVFPFPQGPAAKAGIRDSDRLVKIDDLPVVSSTPMNQIEAALRGPVGQRVTLELLRPVQNTSFSVSVVRAEFPLPSVTWRLDLEEARLGVIKVNLIAASTPDEIEKAITELSARGAEGYALDLRDNTGGLLDAGIRTARMFLRSGAILEQQYKGKDPQTFRVKSPGKFANIPLVVLINHNTASAAEIIAGSLKAHGRARILGEASYGKDTIQLVFELKDGSSLHVTAAHWWIPGLQPPISGNGVIPDLSIQTAADPVSIEMMRAAAQDLFGAK